MNKLIVLGFIIGSLICGQNSFEFRLLVQFWCVYQFLFCFGFFFQKLEEVEKCWLIIFCWSFFGLWKFSDLQFGWILVDKCLLFRFLKGEKII